MKALDITGRLFIALIASFAVFTLVAFLHGFFGEALHAIKAAPQPRLVSVTIPKKPVEEQKPLQHIRILKEQIARTGNSGASQNGYALHA